MSAVAPNGSTELVALPAVGTRVERQWVRIFKDTLSYGRTKAGLVLTAFIVVLAVCGPLVAPHHPSSFVGLPFQPPSAEAWLGTDNLARDVFSRVLHGGWSVLSLSTAATVIGMGLGVGLGLIAGYASEWFDELLMRLLDVLLAFPTIVFVLLIVSIKGPDLWLIVLTVGIGHAPRIARVARGATLEVAGRDYVQAVEALGVARWRILLGEILPNITSPLLVEFGLRLAYSVAIIAALSFLGMGVQPPAADWGLMINENRVGLLIQPYSVFVPVLLIGVLTVGVSLIADGLSRAIVGIERETSA
jgi:peptide/nickel transport system permease protein